MQKVGNVITIGKLAKSACTKVEETRFWGSGAWCGTLLFMADE